jgi:hypothetical protein
MRKVHEVKNPLWEFRWALWRLWRYTLHPRAIWRKVKKFYQRGVRGWSDEDTWSFDHYLTRVIVGGLAQLKEDVHGYPAMLAPDAFLEPVEGRIINDAPEDDGVQRWQGILQEIIAGFAANSLLKDDHVIWTIEDDTLHRNHELEAKLIGVRDRGFALFKEFYGSFWD